MLYPISLEGKWGFIDSQGTVVIAPQFLQVSQFSEGIACVRVRGLTDEDQLFERHASGFIDERGEFVIGPGSPPGFEFPESRNDYSYGDFHDGLARFWIGDATGCGGYINRSGAVQIEPQFPRAEDFSGGLACVSMPRKDGSPFGPKADAVIDKNGNFVIQPTLKYSAHGFSEGLCVVRFDGNYGNLQAGVINAKNKIIVPPGLYSGISPFVGGLARVIANGQVGCIDSNGKVVIPIQFDKLWEFEHASVTTGEVDGRKFIVDRTGHCIQEVCLDGPFDISCLRSGFAVVESGGKSGYVNAKGELKIPLQFDRGEDFRGDLALVKRGEVEGYINRRGDFVWQTTCWNEPIRYSVSRPLSDFLPPGTSEALPLEYKWDRVKNAIVFASNADFLTLKRWFTKQFGGRFKLSAREDPPGCLHVDFFGDGVLGSFHAVDVGCENAKSFVGYYSSRNMALLNDKHKPAVIGILIEDG